MSDYDYRIKKGQIRLVTGDDLGDYEKPTDAELAEYRQVVVARMPAKPWSRGTSHCTDAQLDRAIAKAGGAA